jgi:hypothetical protein
MRTIKLHQLNNRSRRIPRRISEIQGERVAEIMRANEMKRDPNISHYDSHINRLIARARELYAHYETSN